MKIVDTQQPHSVPVKHSLEPHSQSASEMPMQGPLPPKTHTCLSSHRHLGKQTLVFCLSCLLPFAWFLSPSQGMAPVLSGDELRTFIQRLKSWLVCRLHLGTDTFCILGRHLGSEWSYCFSKENGSEMCGCLAERLECLRASLIGCCSQQSGLSGNPVQFSRAGKKV